MRKFWWLVLPLAMIVGLFIPYTSEIEQPIKADLVAVAEVTTKPANISKWYSPFYKDSSANVGTTEIVTAKRSLSLKLKDPTTTIFNASQEGKTKTFLLELFTDSTDHSTTNALLSYNTNLYRMLTGEGVLVNEAKEGFQRLKEFIELPEVRYGFEIKDEKVTDTAFLVISGAANDLNIQEKTDSLFKVLIGFANKNVAGFTGVRIFHKEKLRSGNYHLSAGIAVTKAFPARVNASIEYQRMPFQKNLLMVIYTGPYGQVNRAYEALHSFAMNNRFTTMAIPFEKWEEGPITVGDNDLVRLKVYLPVF